MQLRIGEGNTILIEVVANRNLATEGVTTAVEIHLVVLVVASLHQYGHVELGASNGVDDTHLEAEVRQRHDDTVDLITILAEELGALATILHRLHGTIRQGLGHIQNHITVTGLLKLLAERLAYIDGQRRVEIGARTDDQTKGLFSGFCSYIHSLSGF